MNKRKQLSNNVRKNIPLILMSAPAVIILIMFKYVPMFGTVLAFKNYTYRDGIWGSAWAGLTNFKYIFSSKGRGAVVHLLRCDYNNVGSEN